MLKVDFNITFFCKSIPESLKKEFKQYDFKVRRITNERNFLDSISSDNVIVLDGYDFDIEYQKRIKTKGCKLVFIDDLHNQEFMADLIINHTPGITPKDYNAQPYTSFALGLDYALLRPSFLKQAKEERRIDHIKTLLITFGGADPQGLTKKTLQVAIQCSYFKKIIVLTGTAFKEDPELLMLLNKDNRIEYRKELEEQGMLTSMLEADLAIAPSSTVLLEIFTVGVPVISGYYIENQRYAADVYRKNRLIYDVGDMTYNYQEKLKTKIDEIFKENLNDFIQRQKEIMRGSDGNITKIIMDIYSNGIGK